MHIVVSGQGAGSSDCRGLFVAHDATTDPRPFSLQRVEDGGSTAAVSDNFESLDEALAAMDRLTGNRNHSFVVRTPDGRSVQRPGGIPIEEILAGMGWIVARHLKGYLIVEMASDADRRDVRAFARNDLPTDVLVGEVVPIEDGRWCVDLFVAIDRFVNRNDLEAVGEAAFGTELSERMLSCYEAVTRTVRAHEGAEVRVFKRPASTRLNEARTELAFAEEEAS